MQDTIIWQTDNEIVVPVTVEEPASEAITVVHAVTERVKTPVKKEIPNVHYGIPPLLAYPFVEPESTQAVEGDSVAGADTVTTAPGEIRQGIVLVNPANKYETEETAEENVRSWHSGLSWVFLALAVLFWAVGMKFKGNSKYLKALLSDLTDTRIRHNAFDETVRETSLLVLLNGMWALNIGILLWALVRVTAPFASARFGIVIPDAGARGIGICTAVALIYLVVMLPAYWVVGNVFSDRRKTQLWVKGAAASTALQTFLLFPLALLTLVYPEWNITLLMIGAGVILMGKIVFLYKGFRIFFSEISSWLLFLYYLCSLEIVPLILTYFGAVAACGMWL